VFSLGGFAGDLTIPCQLSFVREGDSERPQQTTSQWFSSGTELEMVVDMEDKEVEIIVKRFFKLLPDLSSRFTFLSTIESNFDWLDFIEFMLESYAKSGEDLSNRPAGTDVHTTAEILDAVRSFKNKTPPSTLTTELFLLGSDLNNRLVRMGNARGSGDYEGAIHIAESIIGTINNDFYPKISAQASSVIATCILTLSKDDSSYLPAQAINYLEDALRLDPDNVSVALHAHLNLLLIYSEASWEEPELRTEKALTHGSAALSLARNSPSADPSNSITLSALRRLIELEISKAALCEFENRRLSILCLERAVTYSTDAIDILKASKDGRIEGKKFKERRIQIRRTIEKLGD
jgi:tetratricopeptide (TPR) repeat protein